MRTLCFVFTVLIATTLFADDSVALRIRFGMKDKDGTDWSGKLVLPGGKVESTRGWRWMQGDSAEGNSWTIATRRAPAQSRGENQRVKAGGQMPMTDNGMIVTLSGVDEKADIHFEAAPGKASFKLADITYDKSLSALDGNLLIERVPASQELASEIQDEDYPCTATAKDGTVYVAYLSFARGKDFVGPRERPTTPESGPVGGPVAVGEVKKLEKPEDFDYLAEPTGGEKIFLRSLKNGKWSEPIAVTDGKQELYRPAIAIDGSGHVWVLYSAHIDPDKNLDHGNWELMAISVDAEGKNPSKAVNISNSPGTDFMPAATADSDGKVWVTWVGGRDKNFNIFAAHQEGEGFTKPQRLTDSVANEWEPAIAADAKGNLAIGWDTYEKGDYDVYVSTRSKDGKLDKPQPVAATLAFEVRPSMAYDASGRLWIAIEKSGDMWGKDFGGLKRKGIPLYEAQNAGGRSIAVRVLADGKWFEPADVMEAMPDPNKGAGRRAGPRAPTTMRSPAVAVITPCFPRIASDPTGKIWLSFRGRPGGNWRVAVGSVWCEYVTTLTSNGWADAAWVPRSNNILDNRPAIAAPTKDSLLVFYSGDGRGEMNPPKIADAHLPGAPAGEAIDEALQPGNDDAIPASDQKFSEAEQVAQAQAQPRAARRAGRRNADGINDDLFVATVRTAGYTTAGEPQLKPVDPAVVAQAIQDTADERDAIKTMRSYRIETGGESLRIWRGEFHRHTEFSPDGGGDGGLLDLWRYAIDAANLDWIGDGDHDYGIGREYSWWTTQKAVTLFTLPGTFVPMYSYERSVSYPEGHRNCIFATRGVRSLPRLPPSSPNIEKPAPDTNMLYMYLKRFNGLCAPHTSATDMGTDWRNHDPEVEPFVEIYQGDRNNYERDDAPRSAATEAKLKQSTPDKESLGGWQPKGMVNLALKKGYRFAFESSSDHVSTHLAYCNVLVTEPTRPAVIDAIRKRRVYGATDNIVADVRCTAGGKEHLMGEEFSTDSAPTLSVHIIGAYKIAKVTIIKDDEEVHVIEPKEKDVKFTWTDPKPTAGKTSYYYVRGEQAPDMEGVTSGELVWASPMWIKYEAK